MHYSMSTCHNTSESLVGTINTAHPHLITTASSSSSATTKPNVVPTGTCSLPAVVVPSLCLHRLEDDDGHRHLFLRRPLVHQLFRPREGIDVLLPIVSCVFLQRVFVSVTRFKTSWFKWESRYICATSNTCAYRIMERNDKRAWWHSDNTVSC